MNARQAQLQKIEKAESMIKDLQELLATMKQEQDVHWGHVGDAGAVEEALGNLLVGFDEEKYAEYDC